MVNPFRSFWMAGFECTDKLNAFGQRVDFLSTTGHRKRCLQDYQLLSAFNMVTVREGIRWSQVEKSPYVYDWTVVRDMISAAAQCGIQQVWDLCHFGYPDDLTPLHPLFARRFAAFARAFVMLFRQINPGQELIVTPINEVSFISWLGGEVAGTSPFCFHNGWQVKYALMKAYIEAVRDMRAIDPGIRIMTTEPLVNIIPGADATILEKEAAARANEDQFQVLDMLSGKICPELGGDPDYLDILGFNYYYNNQWVFGTNARLCWKNPLAEGGQPLASLLASAYRRYRRPLLLSETSHPGDDRPQWVQMISNETLDVIRSGIPFWGICWYPVIDRPDWDHLDPWHQAGIWDNHAQRGEQPGRTLHLPTARALFIQQQRLAPWAPEISG